MNALYVIGNGFDLHHGIRCSYRDFLVWMDEKYSGLIDKMYELYGCCDGDWWADFEHNLGEIDLMEHAKQVAFENSVDLSSDHCDSMWNDAQMAIENEMGDLYGSLQVCFEEWIAQLNAPSPEKQIFINSSNAKFLSFNYTRTLEDLYGIPEQRILHIHGEAGKDEKLIFGHGKNINTLHEEHPTPNDLCHQGKLDEETASSFDIHDEMAWDEMFSQVASVRKPIEEIIEQHSDFFDDIRGVEKVCVYGFSFSDVDMPYMAKIVDVASGAHWVISCHTPKDRNRVRMFASRFEIEDFSLVRLSDVQDPMQLEIEC